jgi:hypothetical protein
MISIIKTIMEANPNQVFIDPNTGQQYTGPVQNVLGRPYNVGPRTQQVVQQPVKVVQPVEQLVPPKITIERTPSVPLKLSKPLQPGEQIFNRQDIGQTHVGPIQKVLNKQYIVEPRQQIVRQPVKAVQKAVQQVEQSQQFQVNPALAPKINSTLQQPQTLRNIAAERTPGIPSKTVQTVTNAVQPVQPQQVRKVANAVEQPQQFQVNQALAPQQVRKVVTTAAQPVQPQQVQKVANAVEQPQQFQVNQALAPQQVTKAARKLTDVSGTEAAGHALNKGAQAVGDAAGSFGKKAMEFAGDNPVAAGALTGAAGVLGLRKLMTRNKPAQ